MRWRLAVQDFTGHAPGVGAPKPKVVVQDYTSSEAAEAAKIAARRNAVMLSRDNAVCVTLIDMVVRRTEKKHMHGPLGGLPIRRKRLTP